jgi:formylglycine-generating enzyme required for sulfatase activity
MKTTPCFYLLLTTILFSSTLFGQNRYALVIGNADYQNLERLANPINDTRDIAAALTRLGWQTDHKTNLKHSDMRRAISDFVRKLASTRDSEGFFWFAGHGVEINGQNYLLPVDIGRDENSALYNSYRLDALFSGFRTTARNKINVVVIDACRDNPFRTTPDGQRGAAWSRGLYPVTIDAQQHTFVMYSAAPGTKADDGAGKPNSPFASAFLENMERRESLDMVASRVAARTLQLTNNAQEPYVGSSTFPMPDYTLVSQPAPPAPPGMVWIAGGTFSLGSPRSEAERWGFEGPQHTVTISTGFYMGQYEVTQAEYQTVIGSNPSNFKGDTLPVEQVSWYDAIDYCNALSRREGLTPAYTISGSEDSPTIMWHKSANGYRLPTEAEWEYACRAGTTSPFNTGDTITTDQANYDGDRPYNGNAPGTNRERTTAVSSFAANGWGLYDMHGNVWEWCWDWFDSYASGSQTDPTGAASGAYRVLRGGSWGSDAGLLRSAHRYGSPPGRQYYGLGFRVVRP